MKKSFKGFVAAMMSVLMIVPAFAGAANIEKQDLPELRDGVLEARETAPVAKPNAQIRNGRTFKAAEVEATKAIAPSDIVSIMVELEAAPAADAVKNLKTAGAYREKLVSSQKLAEAKIETAIGEKIDVTHNYSVLFNGFAFEGEYRLVEEINKLGGMRAFVAPEWESPKLFNTTTQVGAVDAWDLGYTGVGYTVAILDTGLVVDHPAFSTMPDEATVHFTKDAVAEIIAGGNLAGEGATEMNADKVYYNAKIPFRWNYNGQNSNVAHGKSDHGTHVAGIAAGNNDVIKGVAPDAQILAMQVFRPTGGASWTDIVPALEDCAVLGATSANLSLGSACGSETPYDPSIEEVLDRCVNAGVNLAIAAGNDYASSERNKWFDLTGSSYSLVEDVDNGVVGSPSTWLHGVSIAAIENSKNNAYYIEVEGVKYAYGENSDNAAKLAETLGGQTVDFVVIPGAGEVADFEGVDVQGKIAVVKRGGITFIEKGLNAQNAGAVACIIYNNVDGLQNMVTFEGGTIPHVSISGEDGRNIEAIGEGQMFISAEKEMLDAVGGDMITAFSSRGVTANMALKPELAAPGGSIYSAVDPNMENGDLYQSWNGTSMACPHVCGGMALVQEYVDKNFPNASAIEKQDLVNQILMSTATPVYGPSGEYAPVHEQGAGEMNLKKATTTKAYVTVEGTQGNRPKLDLGDDPTKAGTYKASFTVHNFGDTELRYNIEPTILLNDFSVLGTMGGTPVIVYNGETWNILKDEETEVLVGDANRDEKITIVDSILITRAAMDIVDLEANCDINGDGEVTLVDAILAARIALELMEPVYETGYASNVIFNMPARVIVPAGGEKQVDITFTLKDDIKSYMDEYYVNGAMLEGFFELKPVVKAADELSLTVPFIAFYGDWNYAPTMDYGYYYEDIQWNSNNYPNTVGTKNGTSVNGLGINPYVDTENMSYYLEDRNAISPNGDGFLDKVDLLYAGLLRNSYVRYFVTDAEGNELKEIYEEDLCTKGYLRSDGTRDQLGVNYGEFPADDFTDLGVEDIKICITAKLDNDGKYTTNAFTTEANKNWKWEIPVHIDTTAPTAENVVVDGENITFDVTDEHYVAAVMVVDGEGNVKSAEGVFETERGATTGMTVAVANGEFVIVADYAGNEAWYVFDGETLIAIDKPEEEAPQGIFVLSFEDDEDLSKLGIIDLDGDGNAWGLRTNKVYHGKVCATSASYNGSALTPDNWLLTGEIEIPNDQCSLSLYACGQDPSYAAEHFAVYAFPADATTLGDAIEIVPESITTGDWQEYTADLSQFAGQSIMIAVRHFNCTDMFYLNVDLIRVIDNAA